jgi:hypothetical protein
MRNIVSQWRQCQHELLCQRTDQLVGPPTDADEQSTIWFMVTQLPLPDGGITVTLDNACGLADVHDLCARVASACLDDDRRVAFSRAVSAQTGRSRHRPRCPDRWPAGPAPAAGGYVIGESGIGE